jgi:psiF repeat
MRVAFRAGALCFCLSVVAIQATSSQTPASSATPAATPASTAAADDAAAKHAKRTACLAQAKAQKLVGAEKTAYLKSCIDAP